MSRWSRWSPPGGRRHKQAAATRAQSRRSWLLFLSFFRSFSFLALCKICLGFWLEHLSNLEHSLRVSSEKMTEHTLQWNLKTKEKRVIAGQISRERLSACVASSRRQQQNHLRIQSAYLLIMPGVSCPEVRTHTHTHTGQELNSQPSLCKAATLLITLLIVSIFIKEKKHQK